MKNTKRYLSIFLALALAAPVFTGCDNGLDEYKSGETIAPPSDKFKAEIQFVSRLTDGALAGSDADYAAIDNYMVNTLEGRGKSWLTVLDRADGANLPKTMQTALNTKRWTAFAFNRIANKSSYQGSKLYFNGPTTEVKGTPSGSGCYVTGFAPTLNGTRTDKDEDGNVTGTTNVSFAISFNTARFENADQINAFGGKNGVLSGLHYKKQNLLMIGTVKNDLLGALQSAAANTNEAIQVREIVKGPAYTIFMLADSRFWGYVDVASTSLGNGIEAYGIHVMW